MAPPFPGLGDSGVDIQIVIASVCGRVLPGVVKVSGHLPVR
jgi:hypothetical protein